MNPLDLPGPQFLVFYVVALLAAHVAGVLLKRRCRSGESSFAPPPQDLSVYEVAMLADGKARAVETALVRLARRNVLVPAADGDGFELGAAGAASPAPPLEGVEKDVYRAIEKKRGGIDALRKLSSASAARMEARLQRLGLLLAADSEEATCLRRAAAWPMLLVIGLGVAKILVGIARARPVVLLIVLVLVAVVILAFKYFRLPRRSTQGEAALADLRRQNAALESTAQRRGEDLADSDLMLAVALFGTSILASSALAWMHPAFISKRDQSGGSSCGSSGGGCGSGSSCGGGCGGCGG
jgi:uncharacterized protein (TIGR04222 family)